MMELYELAHQITSHLLPDMISWGDSRRTRKRTARGIGGRHWPACTETAGRISYCQTPHFVDSPPWLECSWH